MTAAIHTQPAISTMDWIKANATSAYASASQTASNVWASVCAFFSSIAATLSQWATAAKDGIIAAANQFSTLPTEVKAASGVAVVLAAVAGYLFRGAPTAAVSVAVTQNSQPANSAANSVTTTV